MRKVAIIFLLLGTALASMIPSCANAQTVTVQQCGGFDTTTFSVSQLAVLETCNVTTGPAGIIYATATAETQCGATEGVQMFVGAGASPVNGSNFLGSASGGVLTVTSLIPGFGASPWLIQTNQLLSPGSGATPFTTTTITGQLSGTTGGVGTYSIADGVLSIPGGTNLYTLNALPGGVTNITPHYHQTACNAGFTLTSVTGSFSGLTNTAYYIAVVIDTSNMSSQTNWNNNGINVILY